MLKQDYNNEFFDLGQQKMNFRFFELHFPDWYYVKKKYKWNMNFLRVALKGETDGSKQG